MGVGCGESSFGNGSHFSKYARQCQSLALSGLALPSNRETIQSSNHFLVREAGHRT